MARHSFGKIGITAGGNYSSTKHYDKLTQVRYNGAAWLSKQDTRGHEPTDGSAYWMKIVEDKPIGDYYIRKTIKFVLDHKKWIKNTKNSYSYKYDLTPVLNYFASYDNTMNIHVYLDEDATSSQIEAAVNANIVGCDNQYLFGYSDTLPSVGIPVTITY